MPTRNAYLAPNSKPASLRRLVSFALPACLASLLASPAHAEEIGNKQNLVFSAERMFGIYLDDQTIDTPAGTQHDDFTVIGLGWSSPVSTLNTPRLGIDYFLTGALTLGGNLGIFSTNEDQGGPNSRTTTGVLIGARVGYSVRLGHAVSLWPRGGLTFTNVSPQDSSDSNVLALTLEAPFTFAPVENFAFLAGPCLDLGLTGKHARDDYREILFGLMLGIAGWVEL